MVWKEIEQEHRAKQAEQKRKNYGTVAEQEDDGWDEPKSNSWCHCC